MHALRDRAERALARFVYVSPGVPARLPPGLDPERVVESRDRAFRASLEVYEQLGMLSSAECETWRRRYRERDVSDGVVVAPGVTPARVREHLETLWRDVETAAPEEASGATGRFSAALTAFTLAGALAGSDHAGWSLRLTARNAGMTPEEVQRELDRRQLAARDFMRVIPGPSPWRDDSCVLSAELYADGIVLHTLTLTDEPRTTGQHAVPSMKPVSLTDDRGMTFEHAGGGAGGNPRRTESHHVFTPGVSAGSKVLTFRLGDAGYVIDVDHRGPGSGIALA